jgi:hypothetical protein
MKPVSLLAAAVAGALGFASVSAVGGALRRRRPVDTADPTPATTAAPACDRWARLDDLRKIEDNLASRIAELTAADAVARFLPPRDLPARFSGPAVRAAVETAIAATGVGGRVDEVDCSAYPCLVLAHYAHGGELGKLQSELRHSPDYGNDIALALPMGEDPAGGGTLIGAIVFPRTEPRAAEILASFKRRRGEALAKRVGESG